MPDDLARAYAFLARGDMAGTRTVEHVGTLPEHRGQGYATAVVLAAVDSRGWPQLSPSAGSRSATGRQRRSQGSI